MLYSALKLLLNQVGYELGRKKPSEYDSISTLVKKVDPTIFDVGAHEGRMVSKYAKLFPLATIHAFEPFGPSYDLLLERVASKPRIQTHRLALSDTAASDVLFHVNKSSQTNSLLKTSENGPDFWNGKTVNKGANRIQTDTLDSFCVTNSIDTIDLLKLDVQGAESRVLEGGKGLISRGAIKLVYLEMLVVPTYEQQGHITEYMNLFADSGFELFGLYNLAFKSNRLLQCDGLFFTK